MENTNAICWWEIHYNNIHSNNIIGYSEYVKASSRERAIQNRENHKPNFCIFFVEKDN